MDPCCGEPAGGCRDSPIQRGGSVTPVVPDLEAPAHCPGDTTIGDECVTGASKFCHPRHYYNRAKSGVYTRFSTCDWDSSNKANFRVSERERAIAERVRADSWQVVNATDQRTRNRQCSNTKKLGDRTYDVSFWKEELLAEISAMETESENLTEHKRVLEKALLDTQAPLQIAEECLLQREKRTGIDLVHDDVERDLSKEIVMIKRIQVEMQKLIDRACAQLKMNRTAQHACDMDARDKHHTQGIDDRMHQMRNSSFGTGFHPGIEYVDNTLNDPAKWEKFTRENIARSQHDRECSEKLRNLIDASLRAWATEMWSTYNTVNHAFGARIQDYIDTKNKLQDHLNKVNNEIRDMERNLEMIRKAIHDKEAPMKVAQTRLEERTRRLNAERCHDQSMTGITCEVEELRQSVRLLKDKLHTAEMSMARLLKTRHMLQNDIAVKENSIQVDSRCCMQLRKAMPMDPNIGPIFNMPLCNYHCTGALNCG